MLKYEIAGLKFGISDDHDEAYYDLKPYRVEFTQKPDIEIKFQPSGSFDAPKNFILQNDFLSLVSEAKSNLTTTYINMKLVEGTSYKLDANLDWSEITIYYQDSIFNAAKTFCDYLGNFILSNKVMINNGFLLHASAISFSGKGIVFTAPSGTGKSTHTALWEKYFDAKVLNDDCPVILNSNEQAYIYGSPWCGSKKKSLPGSAPLSAILFLKQSPQNSIRSLTNAEAIPLVLPRVFLPYHNTQLMDLVLNHVEKAIVNVPKYLLECRPDREAVELVYQCIK